MRFSFDSRDFRNSILLVGIGATNKYYNDIVKPANKAEMLETFGDCDLTDAFNIAIDIGALGVYVMNIEKTHDYISASKLISSMNFTYIVPIDVKLSDFYYDPTANSKKVFYIQYLMKSLYYTGCNSTVIATDNHASLYEDIDTFIDAMNTIRQNFKNAQSNKAQYRNVIFVLNNLNNRNWSNVDLAAMINSTAINEYPVYGTTPDDIGVIFDIDTHDVTTDMCYFKRHVDKSISIENLLNMDSEESSPMKFEPVNRIQKHIFAGDMDMENYIGKIYTATSQDLILDSLIDYMDQYLGYLLIRYDIKDIAAKLNNNHPGCVSIMVKMNIQPIGCVEKFEVTKIINGDNV